MDSNSWTLSVFAAAARTSTGRPPAAPLSSEETDLGRLMILASTLNYSLVPKDALLLELGQGVAKRMVKRRGDDVYQMLAFNLPYFPRELLKETFPASSVIEESQKRLCWVLQTPAEMASLTPLLGRSSSCCAGLTKAFQSASERVIRVVAKLMPPFEIMHEVSANGVERCYLNGMYLLATEGRSCSLLQTISKSAVCSRAITRKARSRTPRTCLSRDRQYMRRLA
ncbi:hypothetical protein AB1Y20_009709 [Prymnesium parvum]|uniref:Uncharacterized protein n=1 Tax=Prymnesium parvum TaxID=97485 RepID=A0AB34K5W6_PRYPA